MRKRIEELVDRRAVLKGGLALMATSLMRPAAAQPWGGLLRFEAIAASSEDAVRVPKGYSAHVLTRWGDPIGGVQQPAFRADGSNTAADQAVQFGMHHDGMAYFPLPEGSRDSEHGLLVTNHEYTDRGLIHPARPGFTFTAEQVQKEMSAHGVSVCEVVRVNGAWRVRRPSEYARRVTADTRMLLGGPAAGHELLRTEANPTGDEVWGTISNCANGRTPWGTYLTCEENFQYYFSWIGPFTAEQKRYGIGCRRDGSPRPSEYAWAKAAAEGGVNFERFDVRRHPNEPNRFGWIVELDPYRPESTPVKRTALGRFKHENAAVTLSRDGRAVVYTGDDEADEYLYKFVSRGKAGPDALDAGTLYVAQFQEGGRGRWIPLTPEHPRLAGWHPAAILVYARQAADAVEATPMDRPESVAVDPRSGRAYCSMTNNVDRLVPTPGSPRPGNVHGHIVWWQEEGGDAAEPAFEWGLFVLAGDPASGDAALQGNIRGDVFSSPDGLAFDDRGGLWIQTDMSSSRMWHPQLAPERHGFEAFGNNQMLAVDPLEGRVRRFLTGPVGAEITGFTLTPDGKTLFVNVQHPGEPLATGGSDPANPTRWSSWPDGRGRPRSSTLAITREDGGPIGT